MDPSDAEAWSCAICDAPVTMFAQVAHGGERRWTSTHPPGVGTDHEPVPVPRASSSPHTMVCDFCANPEPVWTFPTVPSVTNGRVEGMSVKTHQDAGWTACEACAIFVEERNILGLVRRVMAASPSLTDARLHGTLPSDDNRIDRQIRVHLANEYVTFINSRTGPKIAL